MQENTPKNQELPQTIRIISLDMMEVIALQRDKSEDDRLRDLGITPKAQEKAKAVRTFKQNNCLNTS